MRCGALTSIEAARAILIAPAETHPEEPIIDYNLGCYDCQLGALDSAKQHLERAFRLQPQCRLMALDDEDLRPLCDTLNDR